jgi:hypothetical protein
MVLRFLVAMVGCWHGLVPTHSLDLRRHATTSVAMDRRHLLRQTLGILPIATSVVTVEKVNALEANGLAARLQKKDPALLKNRIFNIPPAAQVYPSWLRGSWKVSSNLNGYLFPSRKITKERVTQNPVVPGFQKCSVVTTADIGKEGVEYVLRIDASTGLEDRTANFPAAINAYLGYKAVNDVVYDARANPNRISIDFVDYKTVNAERVELFCNARESETYTDATTNEPIFVCREYARQVTFGAGSTVGVPRQVGTNYAHFWTWKQQGTDRIVGNLLTAGFLDPQDSLYFEEPTLPVVIYSHLMKGQRIST